MILSHTSPAVCIYCLPLLCLVVSEVIVLLNVIVNHLLTGSPFFKLASIGL